MTRQPYGTGGGGGGGAEDTYERMSDSHHSASMGTVGLYGAHQST